MIGVTCQSAGDQGARALAFFSRPFTARHLKLTAYEHELVGLVQTMWH